MYLLKKIKTINTKGFTMSNLTRKEQCEIICKHLKHNGDDLDETVMISSVWDALKEIESKTNKISIDSKKVDVNNKNIELINDYLDLLNGRNEYNIEYILDKDNILPEVKPASDEDYWIKKPSYEEYFSECNNFWWVAPYCAKGLWRKEILYSIGVMNNYVRDGLITMIKWKVGIETNFKVSIGKSNKFLKEYIDKELWDKLMSTFNMSDYNSSWTALFITCELFEEVAYSVSKQLGYEYNYDEAQRSFNFIKHIKELPDDALEIY